LRSRNLYIKYLVLIGLWIAVGFVYTASAQLKWEVGINGIVTEKGKGRKGLRGALVTLLKDGVVESTVKTRAGGKYVFSLKPDHDYMIIASKDGYVAKKIAFSTKNVPIEKIGKGFPPYEIEFWLFQEMEGLNTDILQTPIASIRYYPKEDNFNYDKAYTKRVTVRLKQLQKAVQAKLAVRDERYQAVILRADEAYKRKEYKNAKNIYKTALSINRLEKYPIDQIFEIDQVLREIVEKKKKDRAKALELKYKKTISRADNQFKAKDYSKARLSYKEAAKVKPDEFYPGARITEIDNILEAASLAQSSSGSGSGSFTNPKPKPRPKPKPKPRPRPRPKVTEVYLSELAQKYPQGVTEEIIVEGNKKIIRRIVVKGTRASEYKKIIYAWATYYKKNGVDISKHTFDMETK